MTYTSHYTLKDQESWVSQSDPWQPQTWLKHENWMELYDVQESKLAPGGHWPKPVCYSVVVTNFVKKIPKN